MAEKKYVIAMKYGASSALPEGWKDKLARIAGVATVIGDMPHRAQFVATDEAAEQVKKEFSSAFHIESLSGRSPS